ncbi:MAG: protein-L-isoaspartate O-methyltransferase [Candidatus Saccharibacteria bacterium]|nr:protein-L-isoaspartate O-methyltransferase [Candidatus Saccharibacteria bacterium]
MVQIAQTKAKQIEETARAWNRLDDIDPLMERIGDAQYVLLGEASHGTHEYYQWRAAMSKRLISEKGFSFIAVEGDWPDCYELNRYIKHYPDAGKSARQVLHQYKRWPTWMWANAEIAHLAEWMHVYNEKRAKDKRVGFYGLDVYSLWDSMTAVIDYLDQIDPEAAQKAREAYRCFEPYEGDVSRYAYDTAFAPISCEPEVLLILQLLRQQVPTHADDYEELFNAEQNARVVFNAEHYYHTMIKGDAASWNIRDHHMVETLSHLMKRHGKDAKAIVWAHNTHVGDARYTDMARAGMVNIGQLIREEQTEDNTVLVGFGSYEGSVIAGKHWDAPMEVMKVPPAKDGSWEGLMHEARPVNKLILSDEVGERELFWQVRDHRAIGVVYDPSHEHGNYVPSLLPERYDAFVYIDKTTALHPLHLETGKDTDFPETYPWAV